MTAEHLGRIHPFINGLSRATWEEKAGKTVRGEPEKEPNGWTTLE